MSQNQTVHSVLYVDIGSVNTRVSLYDQTDGKFAYIGAASANSAAGDAEQSEYLGVVEAIKNSNAQPSEEFWTGTKTSSCQLNSITAALTR